MANMFANAQKIAAPKAAGKKSDKREVVIKGLETLAALGALQKSIESLILTTEDEVKNQMAVDFAKQGAILHKRPDSFRGLEKLASASCELRKRSISSGLNEEEQEFLTSKGIKFGENVSVEECFLINPKYSGDMKLLEKVSKLLESKVPEDFIQHQDKVSKYVITDDAIESVFKMKESDIMMLMPIVGTLAVKPKMENQDMDYILETVRKAGLNLLTEAQEKEMEAAKKAKKTTVPKKVA